MSALPDGVRVTFILPGSRRPIWVTVIYHVVSTTYVVRDQSYQEMRVGLDPHCEGVVWIHGWHESDSTEVSAALVAHHLRWP